MAHFAKNLGDKQTDFYSAGQNKVCAQKTTGAIDKRMQAPKEIIQTNTYNIENILQQLIGLVPQHQLLVLGTKMKIIYIYLYTFFDSSSLFAFV
jgi:hypothetical protein